MGLWAPSQGYLFDSMVLRDPLMVLNRLMLFIYRSGPRESYAVINVTRLSKKNSVIFFTGPNDMRNIIALHLS